MLSADLEHQAECILREVCGNLLHPHTDQIVAVSARYLANALTNDPDYNEVLARMCRNICLDIIIENS